MTNDLFSDNAQFLLITTVNDAKEVLSRSEVTAKSQKKNSLI